MPAPHPASPNRAGRWTARRSPRVAAVFAAAGIALGAVAALAAGLDGSAEDAADPERADPEQSAASTIPPERYSLVTTWQPGELYSGVYHPEGIDVGRDGLIYVAERGNHRVSIWHQDGAPESPLGRNGSGPGELRAPEDVAVDVDRDRVYVADTGNRRVQVLHRRSGASLAIWGDLGLPRGIALGPDGRVFVADAEGDRILVFDGEGRRQAEWGGPGRDPGQLDTPLGMAVGADGHLHIADSGNQRIQRLDGQGRPVEQLDLSNAGGPGGAPQDVGVDANGDLHVAVERGILVYRGRNYLKTLPPLREWVDPRRDCRNPCACREFPPEVQSHEGVRRLALHPTVGLFFTYAPALRNQDRVVAMPKRSFERVFPSAICAGGPGWRHLYDPTRIDGGDDPYAAHTLDTSSYLRVHASGGSLYDRFHVFRGGPGADIAADRLDARYTRVITGNEIHTTDLRCFLGCPPWRNEILDANMRSRRDRTGERIPDFLWWNTAVASRGSVAALDTGNQRVVVRAVPAAQDCGTGCAGGGLGQSALVSGFALNAPNAPFRAFRDLAYDSLGTLWVLARDGELLGFDTRGRPRPSVQLAGLRRRPLEAIAPTIESGRTVFFVLSADGWVFKHDAAGALLAAWELAEVAGPGRYRDLSVDPLGRVLVPDGAGDRILVFERQDGSPVEAVPDPRGAPCRVAPDKVARPARLPLGETTELSLSLEGDCGPAQAMADVVLVVDASCMMSGERLAAARQAGLAFVDAMHQPRDRLALATFTDEAGGARLVVPLTEDKERLRAALGSLRTECLPIPLFPERRADGRISDGLRAGREALFGPAARAGAGKALVLLSPSALDRERVERMHGRFIAGSIESPVSEREHAAWEGWRLWEAGVRVETVGLGEGQTGLGRPPEPTPDLISMHPPDQGLLASLAAPAAGYRLAAAPAELPAVFAATAGAIGDRVGFRSLTITDRIPANMRLVPGSVRPPATVEPDGSLRWHFRDVGLDGPPVLSYRLEPLDPGRWPTNIEARAVYTDGLDYAGASIFPIPEVEVIAPEPSPTHTPEPTPTPRFTATGAPSPTGTPTALPPPPGPTPTGRPGLAHLPILFREQCVPKPVPLDVALVIDTSSSMNGAKLATAREAGRTFVELLDLPEDRATVIGFDETAHLAQPLTGDRAALEAALDGLDTAVGTRIDRGLWAAVNELGGSRARRQADRVIVLLTDGRPQLGTEGNLRLAAGLARDLGAVVYAIGLGEDVLPAILLDIAGDAGRVYQAPSESDLVAIYRRVARIIPCRS